MTHYIQGVEVPSKTAFVTRTREDFDAFCVEVAMEFGSVPAWFDETFEDNAPEVAFDLKTNGCWSWCDTDWYETNGYKIVHYTCAEHESLNIDEQAFDDLFS